MPPGADDENDQNENDRGDQNDSGNQNDNTDDEDFDKPRALNTIRTLRDSERTLKRQIADLNGRIKSFEDKDRTDTERLVSERDSLLKERDDLLNEKRQNGIKLAFVDAATKAGATKPDALFRIASSDIEVDDEGNPTNLKDLLKTLQSEYTELFATSDVDAGSGRGRPPKQQTMNDLIRASRGR